VIPDELMLAAIERADRHNGRDTPEVPTWAIYAHLGLGCSSPHLRSAQRVARDRVVAVQPKPSFLAFFQSRRAQPAGTAGVKYGSDGGRTLS
jgi:hypothetical protein